MEALKNGTFVGDKLTTDQLNLLRSRLLDEKKDLMLKSLEKVHLSIEEELSDEVDHANADLNNFQQIRFRERSGLYLKKVTQALKRMEEDEYGLCQDCGNTISASRLLARPTATLCIQCKEEAEREEKFGRNFRFDLGSTFARS